MSSTAPDGPCRHRRDTWPVQTSNCFRPKAPRGEVKGNRKGETPPNSRPRADFSFPKQPAGKRRDATMDPAGTPRPLQPAPRTHLAPPRILPGSPRPGLMGPPRIRPLDQRCPLLGTPPRNRRRWCLRSPNARAKLLLRRGPGDPYGGAAHPIAGPKRTALASGWRTHRLRLRHPEPVPRRMQATRNPLRRPPPEPRLPRHRHSSPNHQRRDPRNTTPS